MKKRVLSMMLVVAMLISMIVMPTYAEMTEPQTVEETCPCCNTALSAITDWQEWPVSGTISASGHYRLTASGDTYGQVQVTGGTVILDLNGQTLSTVNNSATAVRPLYAKGGELHVYDTSAEKTGTVIGKQTSTGGAVYVHKDGTMHIHGGTFKNNAAYCASGGVVNVAGKLTLHDGVIEGKKSNTGGALLQTAGTFIMDGGTITGGESTGSGGTVQVNGGTFTLNDGTIKAGTAATSGGTIFAQAGTLNLNGGTVEFGTVGSGKYGKAVYAGGCIVNIGSVNIPGAVSSNVAIASGVTLSISGAPKIGYMSINAASAPTIGEMTDGAQVHLAVTDTMALAEPNVQMEFYLEYGYFLPYTAGKVLTTDGASVSVANFDCPCCDAETVTWTKWEGTAENGKHYYLAEDLDLTASISVAEGTSVTLDLRGKKITSETVRAFMVRGNLDIVDSGVAGTVTTGTTGTNGGVFSVQESGNLELHGGTYVGQAAPNSGSVAYVIGTMTVHEGVKLDGSKVADETKACGTVYTKGSFTMDGGIIKGATAKRGGSIFVEAGALNIIGGIISDGKVAAGSTGADIFVQASTGVTFADCVVDEVHINAAESVTVFGAPQLLRLKLNPGVLMTLGTLTVDANINVAGSGAISVANENAATYLANGYIEATDGKEIKVVDNVLTINTYICPCCDEEAEWTVWTGEMTNGGHYYLDGKLVLDAQINVPKDTTVTLDLRGNEITSEATRAFIVNGNLNIVDSKSGGKVTSGTTETNGGVFSVQTTGNLELFNGTYIAQAAPGKGSVAYVIGSMTIHEGVTLDASAAMDDTKTSGAVYTKGVFNMDGGAIIGGTAKRGGSIFVEAGTLNVTGGAISGGKANTTEGTGDDIYVQTATVVTLADCEVANEIHIQAAETVNISGNAVLSRLKLSENVLLTLGELKENADISVAATGVFTVANENAKAYLEAGYIKAANTSSVLVVTDNVFKFLAADAPKCPHCGEYMEKINWAPFNAGAVKENGGHFYLNKAIERTGQLQINEGVDSVIDLRDKDFTVTKESVRAFIVYGTLTIMDTVDNGTVTGLGTAEGGAYKVMPGGKLNLLGGTSTAGAEATKGGVIYAQDGDVEITGGTVRGGKATGNGGNIFVIGDAQLTISGGVIGGGAAAMGGNIHAAAGAKVIFSGGNVQNGSANGYGGNISIAEGAEMDLSGGNVRGGTGDVAAKLTSGFRGDNIYVEGTLNMSEGHITVTNTDCFGNAVLARGTATVNITGKAVNYSVSTSGNIHLLSTCTLNADFGVQMVYRYGRIGWYKTLEQAVEDYGNHENHRYVKLLFAEDVTIPGKEVYLDVNGLEVNVTVDEGGTLYGMDTTATVKAPGTGSVVVTGAGTVAVDADRGDLGRYIALTQDGKTTFHQIKFNIHAIALRTSAAGFYYRTKLYCDPVLAELVDRYGVVLSVNNVPGVDFETETGDTNKFTVMNGNTFESGKLITSGSVFNVMKQDLSAEENKARGEMKVYSNAYAKLDLGGETAVTIMSDNKYVGMKAEDADFKGVGYSMYDVMKSIDEMYPDMTEAQQAQVADFYDTWYAKGMSDWDLASFSTFTVGFGRANITPDYTVHMNGGNLDSRYSTDVKDQLYVTCIATTDENGQTALMITQDLINAEIAHSTRQLVATETGVPFKNIMISATHTHSAPSTAGSYQNVEQYVQLYKSAVVEAAKAALEDRAPAVAQTGSVIARTEDGQQLVFVRRYKQLFGGYRGGKGSSELNPISAHAYDANETMQIVKFVRGNGKKDVLMTNLGAHATFNGATTMTSLSADFPGAIRDYVESNSDCLSAHFISGAADQNPTSELSDNHSFDYIGYGQAVAKIALGATLDTVETGDVKFASKEVTVDSNKKDVNDAILAKANEADAVYQAEGFAAGEEKAQALGFNGIYHARSFISRSQLPDTQKLGINALAIGELSFVFASYEMFGCNAADLIAASPYENTFVITCANNSGGYVPADKAYDMGCYESYTARVARGAAETLVNEFVGLLNNLHG